MFVSTEQIWLALHIFPKVLLNFLDRFANHLQFDTFGVLHRRLKGIENPYFNSVSDISNMND